MASEDPEPVASGKASRKWPDWAVLSVRFGITQPQTQGAKLCRPQMQSEAWVLSIFAWVVAIGLFVSSAKAVGSDMSGMMADKVPAGVIWFAFWQSLLVQAATLTLGSALAEFGTMFARVGEGEVFTSRNIKTLRTGAEGLISAAALQAVVVPTILAAMNQKWRGVQWEGSDFAIGVAAIGMAVFGFARIMQEGLRLQQEVDEIV